MRRPVLVAIAATLSLASCTTAGTVATVSPSATPTKSPAPSPSPSRSAAVRPTASPSPAPVAVTKAACGSARAPRTIGFRVAVDEGLPTTPEVFAKALRDVLCDSRSWIASRRVRFRYDPNGSLLFALRTPDHTESRCLRLIGLSVRRMYSCATHHEIVLNSARWFGGSPFWPGPLGGYRRMLVNHETGHALGQRHQYCPRDGAPAPVMMQQSKGLTSPNGKECARNSWPLRSELARV